MSRFGLLFGVTLALLAPVLADNEGLLEDALAEALGRELEQEDCSLLNQGPSCDASAFLQTAAAYHWSSVSSMSPQSHQSSHLRVSRDPPPSFLELQEETATEAAVGEVRSAGEAQDAQKVGEVHMDRSQAQKQALRQGEEDGVEVFSASQAPTVTALASEATHALNFPLSPLRSQSLPPLGDLSGAWLALLVAAAAAAVALLLHCARPLEEHVPQWLPEALSQDLVARDCLKTQTVEETSHAKTAAESAEHQLKAPQPPEPPKPQLNEKLRQMVEEAPVCGEANLQELLPSAAGYDCAFSKPVSSGPVKVLARIEGALPGGPPPLGLLRAPLSQRSCVCFTALAEREEGDGKRLAEGVDFQVSLVGAPEIRIDVQGHDVKLLDSPASTFTPFRVFSELPKHWRQFVAPEPEAKPFSLPTVPPQLQRLQSQQFRFREEVLQVGSEVVLWGELLRDSSGRIFLQPFSHDGDSWRTSWELEGCQETPRVLASSETALAAPKPQPKPKPELPEPAQSCFDDFATMMP